jgi:hypothetical protein
MPVAGELLTPDQPNSDTVVLQSLHVQVIYLRHPFAMHEGPAHSAHTPGECEILDRSGNSVQQTKLVAA